MYPDNQNYKVDQGPFGSYRQQKTPANAYPEARLKIEPYRQATPSPEPEPQPQPKSKKSKKNSGFVHRLEIIAVVIILVIATFFGIILIAPDSEFSQAVVKNTVLNEFINLQEGGKDDPETQTVVNNSRNTNNETEINPADIPPFAFAQPDEAKTAVEIVDEVLPSVLSISIQQPSSQDFVSGGLVAGTGFIVNAEGLVVTNKHVISSQCQFGEAVEILASNYAQNIFKLELLTVDPIYDIAILQIENTPQNLQPINFTDSDNLQLGSQVLAIGNALGELQNTVTQGIVSGLSRSLNTSLVDECTNSPVFADGLIQTDAAINQGNSGGPLFDASGQLIGMNTFGTQGAENVGLAIPSNAIVSALNSYRENGIIERPKLGIFSRSITPLLEDEENWLPVDYGEIIIAPAGERAVERGSSADQAGLKAGDIILKINDQMIESTQNNPSPLRRALLTYKPGDNITLTVLKSAGQRVQSFDYESETVKVQVTLGTIIFEI